MSSDELFLPVYRKLLNHKRFYKINTINSFTELQLVGKKVFSIDIVAEKFPEKILIQDMINQIEPYQECEREEFDFYLKQVEK